MKLKLMVKSLFYMAVESHCTGDQRETRGSSHTDIVLILGTI